jgi:hypothetical protein
MQSWPWMRILLLPLLVAVGACDDASARLDDARAQWRRAAIADYEFDYRTTGFAAPFNVHVMVKDGAVANVDDLDGGPDPATDHAPTIETLFDEIERELEGDADVRVTWDPMLGFPVSAYFDEGEEGDGFKVSAFLRL